MVPLMKPFHEFPEKSEHMETTMVSIGTSPRSARYGLELACVVLCNPLDRLWRTPVLIEFVSQRKKSGLREVK